MEPLSFTSLMVAILAGAVLRGTPIAFAAIGEMIAQRSGVINLGVEGMMLVGAVTAFVVQVKTGQPVVALMAAGAAAAALAAVHALLVLVFEANQIVSGFALTILGTGLSGFFGRPYVGIEIESIDPWTLPFLSNIPVAGDVFFSHDALVYVSLLTAAAAWVLLFRTRFGLDVRAVGEDPEAAHAQGVSVRRTRMLAILIGGFLAGIGGAHLSIAFTGVWSERMTAGQGWIAIGLVIVARWRPMLTLVIAWLFGALLVLHPHLQASGVKTSPYLIAMLPYVITIVALTAITLIYRRSGHGMPAALAKRLTTPEQ